MTERPTVSGPPKGYRPHMPLRVKLEAALRHAGMDPENIEWDHDPALQLRRWDPDANGGKGDTIPPANDPRFITPRERENHDEKTRRRDVPEIARTKRLEKKRAAREALQEAEARGEAVKHKRRHRPFPKGKSFQQQREEADRWKREQEAKADA